MYARRCCSRPKRRPGYRVSTNTAEPISRTHFFKFQKIFTWQAIQCQMQVKFVMSINEHVMTSSDQRSSVCHLTCLLLYEQWTQQIRTSQSWDKVGYRENYIPNYKIFQKHQLDSTRFPVFPGAIWNSRDFQELQTPELHLQDQLDSAAVDVCWGLYVVGSDSCQQLVSVWFIIVTHTHTAANSLGITILCKYATAAYFTFSCIFQQSAHNAYFFPHKLASWQQF